MGFSISYSRVQEFERAAAITTKETAIEKDPENTARQFIADNVDWNQATLDGHRTIHVQGIMSAVTPGQGCFGQSIMKRKVSSAEVIALTEGNIHYISSSGIIVTTYLDNVKFKKLIYSEETKYHNDYSQMDTMYGCSSLFRAQEGYLWSGTMKLMNTGKAHGGVSGFEFLPMINLPSSDMNCMYSTLLFCHKEAERYGCRAVVTFDQPLYHKAFKILSAEGCSFSDTIVILGGFHTIMTFLAAIGGTMKNSGLAEAIAVSYAEGAVPKILSGKNRLVFNRAIK
jgi:hypothetical protein